MNYNDIKQAIKVLEPFKGNSSKAIIYTEEGVQYYEIFSYKTSIFKCRLDSYYINAFNIRYYSQTTSRLQNIIADIFKNATIKELRKKYTTNVILSG